MAEKGFGVKEVNLIGASGTPTITSPNNLNLNANNVAISTNVSIGGTLTVTGNVSVGGTLTYEDVTNIDSVGIVTAREGVFIPDNKELKIGQLAASPDLKIYSDGTNGYIREQGPGSLYIQGINLVLENTSGTNYFAGVSGAESIIYHNGNAKITTSSSGATVTGTLTATTFSGSGASLTNLPVSNSDIQVVYTVTANGSSAYRFGGNGIVSTEDNPDVYLIRGLKYRFINNSGGSHPFQIRQSSGGSAYSAGVTNNGAASGNIDFQVPYSAPSHLYYQCTSHGGMVGNLYIRGAGGNNTNVGVTTFSGAVNVTAAITADDFRTDSSSSTLYLTSANDWRFRTTSGNERVRITSTGNMKVGFVNNINPTTVFDVMASAINQDIVRFTGANYNRGLKISTAASGAINDALIKYDADSQNSAGQHAFLTDGTERLRITTSGKIGIGEDDPDGNQLLIRGASTFQTNKGHIMLTGDSATVGQGPQIVFSESGATTSYAGAYVGFVRQGGNSVGDLVFGTRGTSGDANTVPTERFRIKSDGTSYVLGDFGVGTNSPQAAGLTVENSSEARLRVRAGSNASNGEVALRADGGNTQLGTWSDHDLLLVRNTTTVATLTTNGISFPSGKGIDFSATGGPASGTGGSEILSDYEQGTFSPAWFDDGGTFVSSYSVQYGQYTKIGNVVYFCFGLRIGSFSRTPNSGQACRVGNLPYVSRVVGDDQEPVFNLYARLWGSGTPPETAWLRQSSGGSGSNHVEFYMDESQTGNDHILTGADFDTSASCRVVVNGFYFTS